MINNDKYYRVKNRSTSVCVYSLPNGVRQEFGPGQERLISFNELLELSHKPGGRELMANFLQIKEVEATNNLGLPREIEYDMSEEDVKKMLLEGSLDSFLDCLDFAPVGVIDLIKKYSIELPLRDMDKMDAIKRVTGFDVETALRNLRAEKEDEKDDSSSATAPTMRRVKSNTTGRRVVPPVEENKEEKQSFIKV